MLESPVKVLAAKKLVIQNSYSTNALMASKIQIKQQAFATVQQASAEKAKELSEAETRKGGKTLTYDVD